MKICFVTPDFVRKGNVSTGLPNYLHRLSIALIKMGHVPIIITAGSSNEHCYYDGIEVYRKKCDLNYSIKNSCLNYAYRAIKMGYLLNKELKKLCKNEKIDVVQFASLYGLAIFYKEKVPAIIRLSSYAKKMFEYSDSYSSFEIKVQSVFERLAAGRVQGVISPSNVMAKAYRKDVKKKVIVVETPFIQTEKSWDDKIYKQMFLGKKYILFFGSLYDVKGIYVIIEKIAPFLEKHPDYYFGFVGNVEVHNGKNPLQELLYKAGKNKSQIIYSKALKQKSLYPIIENAEIIVLPSLTDNMPNTCIEAMALEKIVVGTDGASYEQLITDGVNGFLAIPGDAESLYSKIEEALELNSEVKKVMAEKAKKRIDLLAPNIVIKRLLSYYQFVVENKKLG